MKYGSSDEDIEAIEPIPGLSAPERHPLEAMFYELADLFGLEGPYRTPEHVVACARSALNQLRRAGGGNIS